MNKVGFLNDEFRIIHKLPRYGVPVDQSVRNNRQNLQFEFTPKDRKETEEEDRRETQEETPDKDLENFNAKYK